MKLEPLFAAIAAMWVERFGHDFAQARALPMLARQDVMGLGERDNSGIEHLLAFDQIRGAAQGLPRHRLDGGERVLDTMVELIHEQRQAFASGHLARDVAEIADDAKAPVRL